MYKAIMRFRDLKDDHIYEIGDEFPWDGRKVSKKRLKELAGDYNAAGEPVILEVVELTE